MSADPPPKREAHRPSRRNEVVDAAIRVFSEEGPAAPVAAVAKAAGMSQASIYYHFPNKTELLVAAIAEISRRISKLSLSPSGDKTLGIRDAAVNVWAWHEEHAAETRLLYAWSAVGPPAVAEIRNEFVSRHVRLIRERMSSPARPSRLELAVEQLSARTYVNLAMELSHTWASGQPIAGVRDQHRIVDALVDTGMRITGVQDEAGRASA